MPTRDYNMNIEHDYSTLYKNVHYRRSSDKYTLVYKILTIGMLVQSLKNTGGIKTDLDTTEIADYAMELADSWKEYSLSQLELGRFVYWNDHIREKILERYGATDANNNTDE